MMCLLTVTSSRMPRSPVRRVAGEWHPLFHIIATIAFPLVYSVYLGVAESARDIGHRDSKTNVQNERCAGLPASI